ncbi:hypothetical protein A2215_00295 [Candidatus Berkelbacteria bacterium RIFOXYA2_FULL_43_10]|uniref:IrrE N-terminal-like domain-containing protein n=1 Tax=Candidatus Berkelbacteria bacterium RIFOXYA2_FULL_43_10 TaxID=1797472 RepID=A0A1F5E6G7_9BACT|nr:MAG: hypothetical protein A2215_00295 [Candidatus Berkelbacteria bacterium RIFOXYA2_FULL_43_10]
MWYYKVMGEKPSGIKFDNEPEANDYIIRHKEKMTQAEIDASLASFARLEQELRKNHYQEKGSIDIRKDNGRVIFGYRKVYPHLHITSNHGEYVLAPREGENVLDEETTSRLCPRDYPFKKSWSYLIEILDLAMTITDEPQHETQKFRLRNQGTRSLKVYFNPETKPDSQPAIHNSSSDEIFIPGDINSPMQMLTLLHEVGHRESLHNDPERSEAVRRARGATWFKPKEVTSREYAEILNAERDADAFAIKTFKPFMKSFDVLPRDVRNFFAARSHMDTRDIDERREESTEDDEESDHKVY